MSQGRGKLTRLMLSMYTQIDAGLQLTGPIETTMCDYETMESVNDELFSNLSELVEKPFFRYFQVSTYHSNIECFF
jgi:hypothetical protein